MLNMRGWKSYSLYIRAGKALSPAVRVLFRWHTRIFDTPRARVVVLNEHNELLLTKSWTGVQKWELPGGGVSRRETPQQAAARELYEETGIAVEHDMLVFTKVIGRDYTAHIYYVYVQKTDLPKKQHNTHEITALQWFSVDMLPGDMSALARWALKTVPK